MKKKETGKKKKLGKKKETGKKRKSARTVIGIHACLEVLNVRPKKIRSIYLKKDWKKYPQLKWIVEQARRYRIDFFEQTGQQLSSWGEGHQGIALVVEEGPRFQFVDKEKSVLVYIDGLEDPRNLGAVIRTSWLMGVDGIFLPAQKSLNTLTAHVSKIASGGAEHIPVETLLRPYKWIQEMKDKGYWVYGLYQKGEVSIWEEEFNEKVILAVGSEGKGLKQKTKNVCDRLIYIPQKHSHASYNLSVAVALGLGQIVQKMD